MKKRVLINYGLLIVILVFVNNLTIAQNAIVGTGFTSGWATNGNFEYLTASAGTSYIKTDVSNGTGNQYFRMGVDWGGTTGQHTITIGSDVQVSPNTEYTLNSASTGSGAMYLNVTSTSHNYIFKTKDAGSTPSFKLIIFKVDGSVSSVSGVSKDLSTVYRGQNVLVTATLNNAFSAGQGVYLRYTTDNFATSTIVEMTGSGTSYTATIPSGTNTANANVKYYVFTSGSGLTISGANADWYTINLNNNSGSNYSYTVNSSFITKSAGNWSSTSIWEGDALPTTGEPVTINHDVSLDQNATVSSLTINSGKTFTASDATTRTLTITKSTSGSATTISNSGTWTNGSGGSIVIFTGAPSSGDAVHSITGTIGFQNITINKTGGSNNVGASFEGGSSVSGTLEIGSGGYVSTAPPSSFYGSSAVLKFNQGSGATYNVGANDNSWSNTEIPNYITISSGTVNLNAARTATGNLLIDGGTLALANSLTIQGNWTRSSGTFTPNLQTVTLSGTTNTVISTASDASLYDLVVSKTGGAYVSLSSNLSVTHNMTISSGAIFKIPANKTLTVSGTLTNSASNAGLVINSDATGTGSLINNTSNVPATIERYVTGWGSATEGWHLLSSPVSNQTFTSFTTGSTGDYDFYFWRESTNEWVNYKAEAGSFGSTFVSGQGYLASYETTATKQFTGTLNNSDVPFSLTYTLTSGRKGLNLLGNPFPSGIVWDVMAWKPGNTIISGVAKVLSSSTAAYIDLSAGTTIPSMNGFFVYTTEATTLTIPASSKTHGGSWYKNTTETQKLTLTAVDIDGQTAQQSNIMIQLESSFDFDLLYDSEFSPFYAPSFYSFVNNFAYSTNSIPYIGENTVIPFQFIKNTGTNFRIDADGVDQMGQSVMLLDKLTGTVTDLSQSNNYSFTASTNDDPNRFEIHFGVVGINESNNENSLNAYIYGNRLYVMNTAGKANLQLFDLQGRLVQSNVLNGTGLQSLSVDLPAGVYVARVNDEKSVKSVKLVIE